VATVLVVDDDALSREFVCTLLGYRGHLVQEASDGESALASIAQHPPDAVITDVVMPGLDGYELARALRSRPATRHLPIVFSTAHYGPEEIRPLADAYDVRNVIFKPADPTAVLAAIDALPIHGRVSVPPTDQLAETQRLTRSGTWEFDPVTDTVAVSPELRELLRMSSTRLALDELTRRIHVDDLARVVSVAENAWRSGSAGITELRVADMDGLVHELIVSCGTAFADRPSTESWSTSRVLWGVAQDVTAIREDLRTRLQIQTDWHAVRRTVDAFHRAVLPGELPTIAGADLAAVYVPAPQRLDIGAAWYDAMPVGGGRVLVSVGKVAGHDRHPAAVMGHVMAALRAYAHDDPDPAGVLARLNRFLIDTRWDDTFATAVAALFDPNTGRLRVANGGAPAPVFVSPNRHGDAVAALSGPTGPALGVLPNAGFAERDLCLPPGAVFCAYTDGLIDRHDDPASAGDRRLPRVVARAFDRLSGADPNGPAVTRLLAESIVRDMLGGASPDDDVCVAVLRAGTDGV
jgi:serine phosphatase RsbU (regulator of sigma subunit)/CheY-like chemotaxis protein